MFSIKNFLRKFLKKARKDAYLWSAIFIGFGTNSETQATTNLDQSIQYLFWDSNGTTSLSEVGKVQYTNGSIMQGLCAHYQNNMSWLEEKTLLIRDITDFASFNEAVTTDQENTLSLYGKLIKIYNILTHINNPNNRSLFNLTNIAGTIDQLNNCWDATQITSKDSYGNFSDVTELYKSFNAFGFLNYVLSNIKQNLNHQLVPSENTSSSTKAYDLLFSLTQVGSQGVSPDLITAIRTQATNLAPKSASEEIALVSNENALSILKSEGCWTTIFGTSKTTEGIETPADAAGSLTAQLKFYNASLSDPGLQETVKSILDTFAQISSTPEQSQLKVWLSEADRKEEDVIKLYHYMVPENPVLLDVLDVDENGVKRIDDIAPTTLQECLAFLLSGYCAPEQEKNLVDTMQNLSKTILESLNPAQKCCLQTAQYAVYLNAKMKDAETEKLLDALIVFNTISSEEFSEDTPFHFGDFLKRIATALEGEAGLSEQDSLQVSDPCKELVNQLNILTVSLDARYSAYDNKTDLLTQPAWIAALQNAPQAVQTLKNLLMETEINHPSDQELPCPLASCHSCKGTGACENCQKNGLLVPLNSLEEFIQRLVADQEKATLASHLTQLAAELERTKNAINALEGKLDADLRTEIGSRLQALILSREEDPWAAVLENARHFHAVLEGESSHPTPFDSSGDDLELLTQRKIVQISTTLQEITSLLYLLKSQAQGEVDPSLGQILTAFALETFPQLQMSWETATAGLSEEIHQALSPLPALLLEIAREYRFCCEAEEANFWSLFVSAQKLVTGLTTWNNTLQNSETPLPTLSEEGWNTLEINEEKSLQELLNESIKALELTGTSISFTEDRPSEENPCDLINVYAQRTIATLTQIPSLLESLTNLSGSRSDAMLPQIARKTLNQLAAALATKTLPEVSCRHCEHNWETLQNSLQTALSSLPELTKALTKVLAKCCASEAQALYDLATATEHFALLAEELTVEAFLGGKNDEALEAAQGLTSGVVLSNVDPPFVFAAHEELSLMAITQLSTNVKTLNKAWATAFNLETVSDPGASPPSYNCTVKENMLERIQASLARLSTALRTLNASLKTASYVCHEDLATLLDTLKGSLTILREALPTQSHCSDCSDLSFDDLLITPLEVVENALGAILETLTHHTPCIERATVVLNFLKAVVQSTSFMTNSEADTVLLEKTLETLGKISEVDFSIGLDELFPKLTDCLTNRQGEIPSYDDVPEHEVLIFLMKKLIENFSILEETIQKILQTWDITPPSYCSDTHQKLVELVEHVTSLRASNNSFWTNLNPLSNTCSELQQPSSEDVALFQEAFNALNVEALLYAYTHLQNPTRLEHARAFVAPLELLRHAISICVETPIFDVTVEGFPQKLNLFHTTKLAPVLVVWEQALEASDEARPSQIETLAKKILNFYTKLGGLYSLPTNQQPPQSLTSVRTLLTEHVLAIGNALLQWIEAALCQPIASQPNIANTLKATAAFLTEQTRALSLQQEIEAAEALAPYHRTEAPEEVTALNSFISALQIFISPLIEKSADFLTARCGENFEEAIETLYRQLEAVCNDLTVLASTMAETPPEKDADPTELSNAAADLKNQLEVFLGGLNVLPDDVLCTEDLAVTTFAPVIDAAAALNHSIHTLASSLEISLSPHTPTLKGLSVEASLTGLQRLFQELPTVIADFVTYAEKTFDHIYIEATVETIQTIATTLRAVQTQLSHFAQTQIVLCRERTETPLILTALAEDMGTTADQVDVFYKTLRMRFWTKHKAPIRSFREQVEQHLAFFRVFQALDSSCTALEDDQADESYLQLNHVFTNLEEVLLDLTITDNLTEIDTFCQELPYDAALNAALKTARQIFFKSDEQPQRSEIETQKTNPLEIVQEDLNSIVATLEEQATTLASIDEFPTGNGSYTLLQTLLRLATLFAEKGSLRTVFETIFSTLAELAKDFDTRLAEAFPAPRDLRTPFEALKREIEDIANCFNPEQCQRLAGYYAELACELETLAKGIIGIEKGPKLADDLVTLIRDTVTAQLPSLKNKLDDYYKNQFRPGEPYCASFSFHTFFKTLLSALRTMNQTYGWETSAAASFESEDTCTMLDEAHDRFFIALESVRMALLEQADRIQTLGLTTIWTNTQLAQLGTLTDLLTDLVAPLQTLRDVLITDEHGLCSNCVAQDDEHDSGTFLTALTEEKIDDMNCALIYLKDVLERLLYDRAFEIAWLKILNGATNLAETINQGASPLDRAQTMADTLTRLLSVRKTPFQAYLNASQPSAAHLAASQNLAAILAPDFQPVPPPLPFTNASWEEDVAATLEQIKRLAPVVRQTHVALQQTIFFKQPALEQVLAELIPVLQEMAQFCDQIPSSVQSPIVLENRLTDRAQLKQALTALAEEVESLLKTLQSHTAEQALRKRIASTQAIFAILPRLGELFRQIIEGQPASSFQIEQEALYKELQQHQPKATSPPTLRDSLAAVQAAWGERPDPEALVAAIDGVHAAAYETMVRLLECIGTLPSDNVSSREADPIAIDVSLTKIRQAAQELCDVLAGTVHFMTDLQFDPTLTSSFIGASSPLQLLANLDTALKTLSQTLIEVPGTTYEEVVEDALLLEAIADNCQALRAILQKAQDLVDQKKYVESIRPSYRLLLQFQALKAQVNAVVAQPGLPPVSEMFRILAPIVSDFEGDANPDRLIALLQKIAHALESLGSPVVTPIPESDTVLLSLSQTAIAALIEEAVTALQTPPQAWIKIWLSETYTLQEDLIRNVRIIQQALDHRIYNWNSLQTTLETFATQLTCPNCCVELNQLLENIYGRLETLSPFFKALATLETLPVLGAIPYEKLCTHIVSLTHLLTSIKERLAIFSIEPTCQNSAFIDLLKNTDNDLATLNTTLKAIATLFNVRLEAAITHPFPETTPPCHQTDILLARLAPALDDALAYGPNFLKTIVLKEGESRPYRIELIVAFENLIQALEELQNELNAFSRTPVCPNHDLLDGTFAALGESLETIKKFVQDLIDRLDAFKYASVGKLIHDLEAQAAATGIYAALLKDIDLEKSEALAADTLSSLKVAIETLTNVWQQELKKLSSDHSELIGNEKIFENLLTPSEQLTQALQKITQATVPAPRIVSYSKEQIEDDLKRICKHQTTFKTALEDIYTAWVVTSRKHSPGIATIVESFEAFYKQLESARETLTQDPTPVENALAAFLPPDTEPSLRLLLHRLAFALKNATCCDEYVALLEAMIAKYATVTAALDSLASGETENPSTVEEALEDIPVALGELAAHLEDSTTRISQTRDVIDTIETTTCFTEELAHPTLLKTNLQALAENLDKAKETVERLARARQSLYPSDENKGFEAFADVMATSQPYYQEDIDLRWAKVNKALDEHIQVIEQIAQRLNNKSICFLLDANHEYGEKLKAFDSMRSLLTTSQAALIHYRARCCARATEALRRITNRLIPLTALKGVLFQNASIDDAETCCALLAKTMNTLIEQLEEAQPLDPHALETLKHFDALEQNLAMFETALTNYGHGLAVPSGIVDVSATDLSLEEQIKNLQQMIATTLTETWTDWISALEAQDGTNRNERCYSKAAEPFTDLFKHLQKIFESRQIAVSYQHDTTPFIDFFEALAAAFGQQALKAQALDALLKFPTCCVQRAEIFHNIYMQLELGARCLEGALERFDGTLETNAFTKALEATTTCLQDITGDLSAIDYGTTPLRCKADVIVARTTSLFSHVKTFVTQLKTTLAFLGSPNPLKTALTFTSQQEACQRLEIIDEAVAEVFERITASLTTFANRFHEISFIYNTDVMEALQTLLQGLEPAKTKLDAFRRSLGTPCTPCFEATEIYPLAPILTAFQSVLQAITENRNVQLAKIFHTMTEAARTSAAHFETLLKTEEEDLTRAELQDIQAGFTRLALPFEKAVQALQETEDFDIERPETYTVYQVMTTHLQAIDEELQLTLQALGQSTEISSGKTPNEFGPDSMKEDWGILRALFENLSAVLTDQTQNPAVYHRALIETWTNIATSLNTLSEAIAARTSLQNWLEVDALDEAIQTLKNHEQIFLESIQRTDPCSKLNDPLKQFLPILKALTQIFTENPDLLKTNLEEGTFFQEKIQVLTDATNALKEAITSASESVEVNNPLVLEGLVCFFNEAHMEQIATAFNTFKGGVLACARTFDPDLTVDASAPSTKTTRTDLYREIADEFAALGKAFSTAVAQAKLCPVRDYRAASVTALESFHSALENLVAVLPETFTLIKVCNYCDGEAEQNILEKLKTTSHQLKDDVQEAINDLKQTCCSRLVFQLFTLADHLSMLQQYISKRSEDPQEELKTFLQKLAKTVPQLSESIATHNLTDFRGLFTIPESCLAPSALTFVQIWDESILLPLLDVFQTDTPVETLITHPTLYRCTALQEAITACLSSIPFLNEALTKQLTTLKDVAFSYLEMQPLGTFLDLLQKALDELIALGAPHSPLRGTTFCPSCEDLTVHAEALANNAQALNATQTIFTDLHILFERYCDHETILLLHKYNEDLQRVLEALTTVNDLTFLEKWKTFTDRGPQSLNDVYIAESSGNTALETIRTLTPVTRPTHCSLGTFLHAVETLQTGMNRIATVLLPALGETFTAIDTPLSFGESSVLEQGHNYLGLLETLNALLQSLLEKAKENQVQLSKEMISAFSQLYVILIEKAEKFKDLDQIWALQPPCPTWGKCELCRTCTFCVNDSTSEAGPHVSCHVLHHISLALINLATIANDFGNSFVQSCCNVSFQFLFPIAKGIGDVGICFGGVARALQRTIASDAVPLPENLLADALQIFTSGIERIHAATQKLVEDHERAHNIPGKACRMSYLSGAFNEILIAFRAQDDGYETGLVSELLNFLARLNVDVSPLQEADKYTFNCNELEAALSSLLKNVRMMVRIFSRISEDSSKIRRKLTSPDMALVVQLRSTLLGLASLISELSLKPGQTPLCSNCPNNQIQKNVPQIAQALEELANVLVSMVGNCCQTFGNALAQTQEILVGVFMDAGALLEQSDSRVFLKEGETLMTAVEAGLEAFAELLSHRQALPPITPELPCVAKDWVEALDVWNDVLQKELRPIVSKMIRMLGLTPWTSSDFSEDKVCKDIVAHFANIPAVIGAFARQLMAVQQPEEIRIETARILSQQLRRLAALFVRAGDLVSELVVAECSTPLCPTCHFQDVLAELVFQLGEAAKACHGKAGDFDQTKQKLIRAAKEAILNEVTRWSHEWRSLSNVQPLAPYVATLEHPVASNLPPFANMTETAVESVQKILNALEQLPDHRDDAQLEDLKRIQSALADMRSETETFLRQVLGAADWEKLNATFPPLISLEDEASFERLLASAISSVANSTLAIAENCLYEHVTTDDPVEAGFVEALAEGTARLARKLKKDERLAAASQQLASASKSLAENLRPNRTHFSATLFTAANFIRQIAEALDRCRPALPSCEVTTYGAAWAAFFEAFTPLAEWSVRLAQIEATSTEELDRILLQVFETAPFQQILQAALQLQQATTGEIHPQFTSPVHGSALLALARSCTQLKEALTGFSMAARTFHIEQRVLVDLNGTFNLRLLLPAVQDAWETLQNHPVVRQKISSSEGIVLNTALTQLAAAAEPIVNLLVTGQDTVRVAHLHEHLDALTTDEQNVPVTTILFQPAYDEQGLPQLDANGKVLASQESLLTQTGLAAHHAEILKVRTLGLPFCPGAHES